MPEGEYFVSVITEMELLSYPLDQDAEGRIRSFLAEVEIVELNAQVAQNAVELRRQHNLKLPDAIIAATALTIGAELLTNDAKLFGVRGISCRALKLREP